MRFLLGWRRWREPRGAAASEYALVLALVLIAAVAALTTLGEALVERLNALIEVIKP